MNNPPPARQGVGPSSVVTPSGPWPSMLMFLVARFPYVTRATWLKRLEDGDVFNDLGQALSPQSPFEPQRRLYYFRSVAPEPRLAAPETVLWQNEHVLVADKPHGLPVVPSGQYLQETLLVRLKNRLGLPDLAPVHRIDRDTAGLVLFSKQPATRGVYQALFRTHRMQKTYEAIAAHDPTRHPPLLWPLTRQSRIVPSPKHFMQQCEVAGEPNAITHIRLLQTHGALARYALTPVTGQRHQLRVHMNALGLPIVGDGIYPVLTPEGASDPTRPLQLLAKTLAFVDPLSGQHWHFESERRLMDLVALAVS